MENLAEAISFVNGQIEFHELKAQQYAHNPRRTAQHAKYSAQFTELATFLREQAAYVDKIEDDLARRPPPRPVGPVQLTLKLEDIADLPEDLIRELSITEGDKMNFLIQGIMNEHGGVASLDQLLIGLYRKTGEIHKRTDLNARIYRLTVKKALHNVHGRKGVYSTTELTEEESAALEQGAPDSAP